MRFAGFAILFFVTFLLFVITLLSSFGYEPIMVPLLVLVITGFVIESVRVLFSGKTTPTDRSHFLKTMVAVMVGAIGAYIMNCFLSISAIMSASLVGLIAVAVTKKFAVEVYCGAFVGMVSPQVLHDFTHTIFAGLIAGLVFYLARDIFNGYGGKLGTIACSSWIIMTAISSVKLLDTQVEIRHSGLSIMLYSLGSALLTYMLSIRFKNGPVLASSVVSLAGAVILPAVHGVSSGLLTGVVMAASFAGMSSKEKMRNELEILLSGALLGIMFIYSANHFNGAGGRLGTLAFGSVVSARGIIFLIQKAARRRPLLSN